MQSQIKLGLSLALALNVTQAHAGNAEIRAGAQRALPSSSSEAKAGTQSKPVSKEQRTAQQRSGAKKFQSDSLYEMDMKAIHSQLAAVDLISKNERDVQKKIDLLIRKEIGRAHV